MSEPEWVELARQHGGVDEQGNLRVNGLVLIEEVDEREGRITARLITPLRAGRYSNELEPKAPPFLFDRASDGSVVLPGRWFLSVLDGIRDDSNRSDAQRALAARARNAGSVAVPFRGLVFDC